MPEQVHSKKQDVRTNDITDILGGYREAVRHLWNSLFANSDLATFDSDERFAKIEQLLFDAAVVPQLDARFGSAAGREWRDLMRVVPTAKDGVPISIENPRKGDRNHYWDHPIDRICPEEAELKFIGYFDWWVLGIRDCQYYEVKILRFVASPELEGRRALVDVINAIVVVAEQT